MGCFSCFGGGESSTKKNQVAPVSQDSRERCAASPRVRDDPLSARLSTAAAGGAAKVIAAIRGDTKLEVFTWTHKLDSDSSRLRVEALNEALNALLDPLMDAVDKFMEEIKDGESVSGVNWETASVKHVTEAIKGAAGDGEGMDAVAGAVRELLEVLHALWKARKENAFDVPDSMFACEAVNRFMSMMSVIFCRRVILESPEVVRGKVAELRGAAEVLGMSEEHMAAALNPASKSLAVYLAAASGGTEKVVVTVRRGAAFPDMWREAQEKGFLRGAAVGAGQCCMVFPLFVDEATSGAAGRAAVEQGEGHGPRKEFFSLAGKGMGEAAGAAPGAGAGGGGGQKAQKALFTYNRAGGHFWFNPMLGDAPDLRDQYRLAGWLMGQAVCNRSTLGIDLPLVMFEKLLQGAEFAPTMATLQLFDPEAASGLRNVAALSDKDFAAMLVIEDHPPSMGRNEYTSVSIRELLVTGVQWQFESLKAGWGQALGLPLLGRWLVSPNDLREMVCGGGAGGSGGDFVIRDVFRVVLDDELAACGPLQEGLWEVLDQWPPDLKRRLVHFVTGSDRLPLAGTELLRIEMPFFATSAADYRRQLGMLPQAHTCENILELPNYWEALDAVRRAEGGAAGGGATREELIKVLDERFRLATTQCDVYGLDEVSGAAALSSSGGPRAIGGVGGGGGVGSRPPPSPAVPSGTAAGLMARAGAGAVGAWGRSSSGLSVGSEWSGRSSPDDISAINPAPPPGGGGWAGGGGGARALPFSNGPGTPQQQQQQQQPPGGTGFTPTGLTPMGSFNSSSRRGVASNVAPGTLPALRDPSAQRGNQGLPPLPPGLAAEASMDYYDIDTISLSPEASMARLGAPSPDKRAPRVSGGARPPARDQQAGWGVEVSGGARPPARDQQAGWGVEPARVPTRGPAGALPTLDDMIDELDLE